MTLPARSTPAIGTGPQGLAKLFAAEAECSLNSDTTEPLPVSPIGYAQQETFMNSVTMDAGSQISIQEHEDIAAVSEETSSSDTNRDKNSQCAYEEHDPSYELSTGTSTSSLSVQAGSDVSAGKSPTSIIIGKTGSQLDDDGRTRSHVISSPFTSLLLDQDTSHSQHQLQLWAYEPSPSSLTLAERLEQHNWEDDYRIPGAAENRSNSDAAYQIIVEEDPFTAARL